MNEHYVCRGSCGSMSESPKACDTESCTMNAKMMEMCNCTDGMHQKDDQQPVEEEVAA